MVLRFLGFMFAIGTFLFLAAALVIAYGIWHFSRDLPDYSALRNHEPAVMTRVHATDGALLGEFARERRLYVPIQAVPRMVINAFVSAEDKNFFSHPGVDAEGLARAVWNNIRFFGQRRPEGASTITQQVAKNFLLTNETSIERKIKEALVAMRMEQVYSKDMILELYLNEIFLGLRAYGIAAAALAYFDKSVHELTLAEAAYLAALPKGPSNYDPFRSPTTRQAGITRRNYVLDRMLEDGHITAEQHREARAQPLEIHQRTTRTATFAAEYFTEEVRRQLMDQFGEKKLYEGGLSIRTTLDPRMQVMLRQSLAQALVRFDQQRGWRGPVNRINLQIGGEWGQQLGRQNALADVAPWRLAIVLSAQGNEARIGLQPARLRGGEIAPERETATIPLSQMSWARAADGPRRGAPLRTVADVLQVGDVVYVEPVANQQNVFALRQVPEVSGGAVAMDPHTGRVLAMVGGFSFSESVFNRATQAFRQPGSSFKPFVYAAALDNGYSPASVVMDAPFEIDQGAGLGIWRPENYSGQFYGPQTLRAGIERSRNVMTVRLAQDMGMPMVAEYARRFGIYDDMPQVLSMSLGAGETTVLRMVAGYAMFANGGRRIRPTLIDRIQDRTGRTIFRHDERQCERCNGDRFQPGMAPPALVDRREQVIDPHTAYQITSMMEGVITRGTGVVIRDLNRPLAGKTGTTNEEKDAWFVGYSPDLVMGVYVGFDRPRAMGRGGSGGGLAAPIFREFMRMALAGRPATPFPVPDGIRFARIDARTGLRTSATSGPGVILEAFKPNQDPPSTMSIIGFQDQTPAGWGSGRHSPAVDRQIGSGTGGLY